MRNIVLTEKQLSNLIEISFNRGGMVVTDNSYEDVFDKTEKVKQQKVTKLIREYLEDVLGHPKKFSEDEIEEIYSELLKQNYSNKKLPKEFKNKDILSNLAYFLAKKIWGLKKLGSLEALKDFSEYDKDSIEYIFFDRLLKISVGKIKVEKMDNSDLEKVLKLPKKSYSVSLSQVDKELKGSGYGKEMYFSLIEDCDLLASDRFLYGDSLNIWVNVLPKNNFVYAIMVNDYPKRIVSITSKSKLPPVEKVLRYVVTNNPENIVPRPKYF